MGVTKPVRALLAFALVLLCGSPLVWGQSASDQPGGLFDLLNNGNSGDSATAEPVTISAKLVLGATPQQATVEITADIADGWKIYSVTQPPGGPKRTEIHLDESPAFRLANGVSSKPEPEIHQEPLFDNINVEAHHGRVVWSVPLELVQPSAEPLSVTGTVRYQACNARSCLPPKKVKFVAAANPAEEPANATPGAVALVESPTDAPSQAQAPARIPTDEEPVVISARLVPGSVANTAFVEITAQIADGWHTYSTTQPKGGPKPTVIKLGPSQAIRQMAEPSSHPEPTLKKEPAFGDVVVESFEHQVMWSIPVELVSPVPVREMQIPGTIKYQMCKDGGSCLLGSFDFVARVLDDSTAGGNALTRHEQPRYGEDVYFPPGVFEHDQYPLTIRGKVSPQKILPGGKARFEFQIEPRDGWRVSALSDPQRMSGVLSNMRFALREGNGWITGEPISSKQPIVEEHALPNGNVDVLQYYDGPVNVVLELQAPSTIRPGPVDLGGTLRFQMLHPDQAEPSLPIGLGFDVRVFINDQEVAEPIDLHFLRPGKLSQFAKNGEGQPADANPTARMLDATQANQPEANTESAAAASQMVLGLNLNRSSISIVMGLAFVAGFLLNFMPCVLPVIGLKILSFVQQAGESRLRIFMLNLWYTLGVLAVFAVLATLSVFANFGWGDQLQSVTFNVFLAVIVFAFSLSMLGIWEIPIPGFVGGKSTSGLTRKEGSVGAFFKGGLGTILATPCTGPFLVPVLSWTSGQSKAVAYATFLSVGLGMASPYLLIGAFPQLVKKLPKPGAWMDTFKHVMGFVMLGAYVFLLTTISSRFVVATVALSFGVWAALSWIGKQQLNVSSGSLLPHWLGGASLATAIGVSAFLLAQKNPNELPWQPYSEAALKEYTSQGHTVMIDFTADWCVTCQANKRWALDVEDTLLLVKKNKVITLLADKTEDSEEIDRLLKVLGNTKVAIPYLAIFPSGSPSKPIIVDGLTTAGVVRDALEKAGPSKPVLAAPSTEMAEQPQEVSQRNSGA